MSKAQSRRGSYISTVELEPHAIHPTDSVIRRASVAVPDFAQVSEESRDATNTEKQMGFAQAMKLYPKAVAWSIGLSMAIIMEGYDIVLLANFFGIQAFNEKFGTLNPDGTYGISSAWKSALTNGAYIGEIIGLTATGWLQSRIGYRKTMIIALVLVICFIFLTFFAANIEMLLVGEILCGIPWGAFQTLTTAYASEVCPTRLRAYLTTYNNLCWVFGQLIGSGVLRAMSERTDQWAYRIPFAIQWMWPAPIMVICYFAPESPWWLVKNERFDEARTSLLRLTTRRDPNFDVNKSLSMMQFTNQIEKEISAGTSYLDCFRGINLRRTETVCMSWLVQSFCGSTFMGYSTVFFQSAGLGTTESFDMTLGIYGLGAIGTVSSWFSMQWLGRRTLYLYGCLTLFGLLLVIGLCGIAPRSNTSANWAIGAMLLLFTFVYDSSVGPVCYSLVSELSSTRMRGKTIVLARIGYNIASIIVNILTNYQLNPKSQDGWDWGAKAGLFWAGMCFLMVIWIFFRLPEPKGRTYGELDILFEKKVSARKFRKTEVNPFRGDTVEARSGSNPDFDNEKVKIRQTQVECAF